MDAGFATAKIGTWAPSPLPKQVTATVAAVGSSYAKNNEVDPVKHGGGSKLPLVIAILVLAYCARVVQIKRRRVRRRRARRRARIEATRAHIEHRYAKQMSTPRALPLRERSEPRRSRASSYR